MTGPSPADGIHLLTGSYTPDTGGSGTGLTVLRLDPASGALTAEPPGWRPCP
ncbi:hypothetical protein ACGFNV_46595 [Streptomyces sp. NPDC048751]|uniref:hypothetical protein n=1 Tax=Streptomyces sp. NPDC048751 TaxID=3365591 RepID=UPI003718C0ED